MKSFLLFPHTGPLLILTKFDSIKDPELLRKLAPYGKLIAFEIPVESVKACYSSHFEHVLQDPKQADEFRVLDEDSMRVFTNISFEVLGPPVFHEPEGRPSCAP